MFGILRRATKVVVYTGTLGTAGAAKTVLVGSRSGNMKKRSLKELEKQTKIMEEMQRRSR